LETAARFFYASIYDSVSKSPAWYVCVGKNPYANDSTIIKHPQVEAFCFMAIMRNEKKSIWNDFRKAAKKINEEIQKIDGIDNKLAYARTEMTKKMSTSNNLKNLLLNEYGHNIKLLPFYLSIE